MSRHFYDVGQNVALGGYDIRVVTSMTWVRTWYGVWMMFVFVTMDYVGLNALSARATRGNEREREGDSAKADYVKIYDRKKISVIR